MTQIILWNSYASLDYEQRFGKESLDKYGRPFNLGDYATVRPLGAHQIASWLRQNGYTVVVIDFCTWMGTVELCDVTESYISSDTIAIGVSTSFWISSSEPRWVEAARYRIESRHPNLKWLLGGSREIDCRWRWVQFRSYAEDALLDFLTENNAPRKFDIKTSTTDYSDRDFIQPSEILSLELGRGCQFKCKFCAYPLIGKKPGTYIKNMHVVRDQLVRNYERFGVTRYNFIDDTVNEDEEKIENLARLAQSLPFELEWVGYCRADLIWSRPNTIRLLRESGLRSVFFGIESFHRRASMTIGKGWSGRHAKDFILKLKDEWGDEVGISLGLIVGLPGEPLDSLDEHNEWLIANDIGRWAWQPLHVSNKKMFMWTSEFDRNSAQYGIKFRGEDTDDWYHDLADRQSAINKSRELSIRAFQTIRNCGFALSDYCTTTGEDYRSSMDIKIKDMIEQDHFAKIASSIKSNVRRYVGGHLS